MKNLHVMKALIFLSIFTISSSMNVAILYSVIKPEFLLVDSQNTSYSQILVKDPNDIPNLLSCKNYELVYDLTGSSVLSNKIQEYALSESINFIKGYSSSPSENTFAVETTDQSEIFFSLFKSLLINKWAVVYSLAHASNYEEIIANALVRIPFQSSNNFSSLSSQMEDLKYSQVNTIVLLIPGESAAELLSTLNLLDFLGFAWILPEFSDFLQFNTGGALAKQGIVRLSRSSSSSFLQELVNYFANCPAEKFFLCFKEFNPQSWQILNVVNFKYIDVGQCNPECKIDSGIVWPQGVTNLDDTRRVLKISYEASLYDPVGDNLEFLMPAYQGVELGIDYVNNNLTNSFKLNSTKLYFGGTYYNQSYVQTALNNEKNSLGNAFVAPAMSDLTVKLYETLQNDSINVPMIGYSTTVSLLSSTSTFPLFARVCMPDPYVTVIICMMIKYFGWEKIGVLYIDNLFSSSLYSGFEALVSNYGLDILNKGNNMLPDDYSLWNESESVFEDLGKSEARIIIVFCYTDEITKILLKMHELGFYGDEYEYIAVGWLVDELLNPTGKYDENQENIIRNSLKGSLMFFPVSFIGSFGSEVQKLYQSAFSSDPVGYTAFAFDSVLGLYNTFDQLIATKKDYNNPEVFMKSLRGVKYNGATGPVTFQTTTNDRSPMDHYILNTRQVNGTWEVATIGTFTPTSLNVFTFYENITWPGDSIPSDSPAKYSCPFAPTAVKTDIVGVFIMFLVIFLVICIISFSICKGWNKWKPLVQLDAIEKKIEMTFMDIVNIGKIVIELFQDIGLIPSLPMILTIFKSIGNIVSLDIETMYLLNPDVFWGIYEFVLAFTSVSILFRLLQIRGYDIPYIVVFCSISSDVFYISTLSSLLNIYSCYETAFGPFLHYDCNTQCWKGNHLIYVLVNSLVLIFYCLLMVYEKPKWSSGQCSDQHVCVSATHNYAKTWMQSVLVCLKKVVWLIGAEVYTLVIFVFVVIYSGYCLARKSYNLEILQLWSIIANAGVGVICLFSFFCVLSQSYASSVWLVATLVCWAILLMVGLGMQKIKKMRWPFASNAVNMILLKFAFQNKGSDWVSRNSKSLQNLEQNAKNNEMTFRNESHVPNNSLNI